MPQKKRREGFFFGAMMLSLSGIFVKILGIYFKIPITNMVGAQVMSHFSSAYEVYTFLLSVATSGLPVGISAMVSKSLATGKYRDIKVLMRCVTVIFVSVGALLTAIGLIFSPLIAEKMNSAQTVYCVQNIMPAIFFMSVVSVFRGFFQGYNNMVPTAVSNVIEALVKLAAGYGIALYMSQNGYPAEQVVAGAIMGVTLGTAASTAYLILRYIFRDKTYRITIKEFVRDRGTPYKTLLRQFFAITLPIIVSSITVHLMGLIDAFFVMQRLKGNFSIDYAQLLWGSYSNMSLTIFNLPSFLIINIGVSLVPSISAAFARKDSRQIKRTTNIALKYSSILAFACAFGLSAVSSGAIHLLYTGEGLDHATRLLEIISFALVAVGLTNVTSYILQAIGKSYLSVVSVVVGALVKSIFTYVLVGIPGINIYGAPIATNIAYPVMLILNFWFIYKNMHILPKIKSVFIKPLIAGLGCYAIAKALTNVFAIFTSSKFAVFAVILCAGVVYVALLFMLKLVTLNEIKRIFIKNKKNS